MKKQGEGGKMETSQAKDVRYGGSRTRATTSISRHREQVR